MQYLRINFKTGENAIKELLIAELTEVGFEGFEETDEALMAYINEELYPEQEVDALSQRFSLSVTKESIPQQNWNETWEQNFQPVFVPGFCTIRASFHDIQVETPYEIVITPKMSFGTGHHATTQLVLTEMQHLDLKDKVVLDFGTGTGILAILAEMLGASRILAIDNDEWSYENSKENVESNNCSKIFVKKGSIENSENNTYDIILANINRHILLACMKDMYDRLKSGGIVLMSGILTDDVEIVKATALENGFRFMKCSELNNWVLLTFEK